MYKCVMCGRTGEEPVSAPESDGGRIKKCEYCGSEYISEAAVPCDNCGKTLFEGEYGYEVGDKLFCQDCVSEVLI